MLPEQAIEISKVRFDHAKECLRDAKLLLAGESYDGYRPCSFGRSEAVYLYPYRKPIDLQINRKKSNLISKIHNVNDCKLSKPTKNFFWRLHS